MTDSERIQLANGGRATVVRCGEGDDARSLLERAGVETGRRRPVVVVCGGAEDMSEPALVVARTVLGPAVASAAALTNAAVVDGGTDAGVMAVIGAARAERASAMPLLVGVAPAACVALPGASTNGTAALESNHTHFVLAQGNRWGDETALLTEVAQALSDGARVVMVVAGGGRVARAEARAAVQRGWPLLVLAGTGGTADAIAGAARTKRKATDPELRAIAASARLYVHRDRTPGGLTRRLAWELQDDPTLLAAWRAFATYDELSRRQRTSFERFQAAILAGGVLATLLGLLHNEIGGTALHWAVVVAPIFVSVLVGHAIRRAAGKRWVVLRGAAETVKSEIFRYRTRTGRYSELAGTTAASRAPVLASRLGAIEHQLMQTDASSWPLTPYDGPLPPAMYGAAEDDDGLTPLDANRYMRIRIGDQLAYYHGRVNKLDRRRARLQLGIIAAGAGGALLAAAGAEVWVALPTAAAAAALSYLTYLQVDTTVVAYNRAAAELAAVEREWFAGRDLGHTAADVDALVTRGESVLTLELGGWIEQMTEALEVQQAEQAEAMRVSHTGSRDATPGVSSTR